MAFAIWQSKGPRIDSGLEQDCAIPFIIGKMSGTLDAPPSVLKNKLRTA